MPALSPKDLPKLARTIRYLQPEQFWHRARLRTLRRLLRANPQRFERRWGSRPNASWAWPSDFTPIEARVDRQADSASHYANGIFSFVGERHELGSPPEWNPAERTQLFRYNLHYFDWAWSFVQSADRVSARTDFGRLWTSWRSFTVFGRWDEWSPYVVSLRAWNLCAVFDTLVKGTKVEADVRASLALHAGFLKVNLERDVGGNHLIKNLKALIGLGVFLNDDAVIELALGHLTGQIPTQVLPDGGHFERSPAYHAQVLADLIDCSTLLDQSGRRHAELDEPIQRMRQWLANMMMPDGDIALFGDSWLLGPQLIAALHLPTPSSAALVHLAESGYVVARVRSGTVLIADVGAPCPRELPAHGQAGCLSFVLSVNGERVIIDTGTSTYIGPRRSYERSTRAHSTVVIDDTDQSEVWGSFRVGRRANPEVHSVSDVDGVITIDASHDGYRHLPGRPIHRRTFVINQHSISIAERFEGTGAHRIEGSFIFDPIQAVSPDGSQLELSTGITFSLEDDGGNWTVETAAVSTAFGVTEPTKVARCHRTATFPTNTRVQILLPSLEVQP